MFVFFKSIIHHYPILCIFVCPAVPPCNNLHCLLHKERCFSIWNGIYLNVLLWIGDRFLKSRRLLLLFFIRWVECCSQTPRLLICCFYLRSPATVKLHTLQASEPGSFLESRGDTNASRQRSSPLVSAGMLVLTFRGQHPPNIRKVVWQNNVHPLVAALPACLTKLIQKLGFRSAIYCRGSSSVCVWLNTEQKSNVKISLVEFLLLKSSLEAFELVVKLASIWHSVG